MKKEIERLMGKVTPFVIFFSALYIMPGAGANHPKRRSWMKREGKSSAACRYLLRVCFSLYMR